MTDETSVLASSNTGPLAIVAGGGALPFIVAAAAKRAGRNVLILAIHDEADPERLREFDHAWVKWGEIGRLFDLLDRHGTRDIVLIGSIGKRPDFSSVKLDFGAVRSLPKILSIAMGGDESVLSGTIRFFEQRGYRMVGAHQIAPEIILGSGVLGSVKPAAKSQSDIAQALHAAKAIGALDIGQAAICVNGRVIAVEGAEGTDGLIERAGALRRARRVNWKGRAGVLAKCARPNQDLRVDLPAVGPRTIDLASEAGLAGIAVEAGFVIAADRPGLIERADTAGLFVVGAEAPEVPAPTAVETRP